ncbi:hypothetical protein ANCDUO_23508 [Ancylostoma duodenale]|uniref:Polysaccharide biosynthesis domain-containing protein n=1 Tax=Ancylostoma duodenale TaxID=51022 RepID=A0A0C2FD38_9BILA|nr:hypothetical protein ANCDUO_23508 [Ancylostoma duodenale]
MDEIDYGDASKYANDTSIEMAWAVKVTEVELKEGGMKEKWHDFCEHFKELVEDYSLGTLMRMEACKGYSEENTIVVPKVSS